MDSVDGAKLKEELTQYAQEIGIDKIGFCSAAPFTELRERLVEHRGKGYESGFEEKDIEKRVDPSLSLPGAQSIVAIALAYPSRLPERRKQVPGAHRGLMARVAWGQDYHHVLRDRLQKLKTFLLERVTGATAEVMVDTGPLSDRAVAERAGIGWIGKNTLLITPEFGSWVYLGEMVTDVYFPPDEPLPDGCGDCTRCLDACPTSALVQPRQLNAQQCLAYLTLTRDALAEPYRDKVGTRLYGCDTCQSVCPYNKGKNATHHPEFTPDPDQSKPLLKPLLELSNREFKEQFGQSSAAWRGKKPIQRNAIIALAHFKDETAVPLLARVLQEDPRPAIRGTAAWALHKIGGHAAGAALEQAAECERDADVLAEIAQSHKREA
ncbi:tRNA epoxyqueuosine(34) reductase QueG [Numidum massiliense]|uniref:tRNA epoxyqueuosine(34) reductase QueG n=1 Tax=Numidum massiliense TaxID=1522315 RepID=UPI0006D55569|nr:tRNA epoxyqueuosine(34) reductase QueG [Numidum massiliense]